MSFDISAVPTDIFFRNITSDRAFWLHRLQELDQDHAPDLPRHISLSTLSASQLRTLVERAHRRHLNCTDSAPPWPAREIAIPIVRSPTPSLKSYDTALLPGGGLFLVNWAAGHIQCFSVPDGECIWTHRPGALTVERFGYDMQENGDVHVLVVSRPPGIDTGSRNLEIIQVSPQTRSTRQLYKCKTEDISDTERFVSLRFAKLSGDVLVICMEDYLLLTYWKENRSIVIRGSIFDSVDLVDGYLIYVQNDSGGKSVVAILLSSIYDIPPNANGTSKKFTLDALTHAKCLVPSDPNWIDETTKASICTFHWKSDSERKAKGINITVSRVVRVGETSQRLFLEDSFRLAAVVETDGDAESDYLELEDDPPDLTHLRSRQSALDPQPDWYGVTVPPSQAGSTLIDSSPYSSSLSTWTLATNSREKGQVLHTVMPDITHMDIEFYSGALYFLTNDFTSFVIQYFD